MRPSLFCLLVAVPVMCQAQELDGQPESTLGVAYFRQQLAGRSIADNGIGLQYVRRQQPPGTLVATVNAFFTGDSANSTIKGGVPSLDAGVFYRRTLLQSAHDIKPFCFGGGSVAIREPGLYEYLSLGAGITWRVKAMFFDPTAQYNIALRKPFQNSFRFGVTISGALTKRFQKRKVVPSHRSDPLVSGAANSQSKVEAVYADRDGDGIPDQIDACPLIPGVAAYNGCPVPDTDADGLNEDVDNCKTEPGSPVKKGCPPASASLQLFFSSLARQIHFTSASDALMPSSKPALDSVARKLLEHPQISLVIYGHTDNRGHPNYNRILSEKRAQAVYLYLTAKGVSSSRLHYEGFGATRPLAPNTDPTGRSINRRVELLMQTSAPATNHLFR